MKRLMIASLILSGITTASLADSKLVKFTYPVNKNAPSSILVEGVGKPYCMLSYNRLFILSQGESINDELVEDLSDKCDSRHERIDYKIYDNTTGKEVGSMDYYNPPSIFSHAFINIYLGDSVQQHTELPFSNVARQTVNLNWG